jgi:hypothetical protein
MPNTPGLYAGLSAPEAYVLINLPRWDAHHALKLGFMGLVAQGILRLEIEERPGIFRTRRVPHLRVAPDLPSPLPPVAASLIKMVRAAEPDGVLNTVLRHCHIDYHQTLSGFIKDCIGPALAARGLAAPIRARALRIFPYNSFALTEAGEAEKSRLRDLIREAKDVPTLLDSDPAKAAAQIAALGSAFLLVEELKPHYPELEKAMRRSDGSSGGDGGYYFPDSQTSRIGDGNLCFDFGHLDFSCFDAGAFDSFDAGFSDAGGGGDGGGGDGGGSSGC